MKENILKVRFLIKKLLIILANKFTIHQDGYRELDEFGASQLLKLANNLKASLKIDESSYRYIANIGHSDARSFYIYTIVSEIMKVATVNMRMLEFLRDSEEEEKFKVTKIKHVGNTTKNDEELINRAVLEGFINEQSLWRRRLSECLVDLICFTETNEEHYYKLFITANELSDVLYTNKDFLEFFECKTSNFEESALDLLKIVNQAIEKTNKNKQWFLRKDSLFNKLPQNPDFLESHRERFKKAILLANKGEKVVLGFTYKVGYGGVSESMHFGTEGPSYWNLDLDYLKTGIVTINFLGMHILQRAYQILNMKPTKIGEVIFDTIINGSGASDAFFLSVLKDHDIGDLVSMGDNDLSEILDVKISKYGYKAYKVKYLVNPLLPDVLEEWWPARYVQKRIVQKSKIRNFLDSLLKVNPAIKDQIEIIKKAPDDKIFESTKAILIEFAKKGILQKGIKFSDSRKEHFGHNTKQ